MAANNKIKRPAKPTVFLSHSSNNRRELLGLKHFLDKRAGGLIDFFLSSDDDSIAHGTIWPQEVRDALDRMSLMLIFVSTEALKSGWTYFEAGYGLHKLGSAKIYCLPKTDKGSLPSPFNILQNRNLHLPRDLTPLIKQCNEGLNASMNENVSQEEFDQIFKNHLMIQLETPSNFEHLVKDIDVSIMGPADSAKIFSTICQEEGFALSPDSTEREYLTLKSRDIFFSTGLRLEINRPDFKDLLDEFSITEENRQNQSIKAMRGRGDIEWIPPDTTSFLLDNTEYISLAEAESFNAKIQKKNIESRKYNKAAKQKPRECNFYLVPNNISVPIKLIDKWLVAAKIKYPAKVAVRFNAEVQRERRVEGITAKIHGSELSLNSDGSYLWGKHTTLNIEWIKKGNYDLILKPQEGTAALISEFRLQNLIASLFQLNIISLISRSSARRR